MRYETQKPLIRALALKIGRQPRAVIREVIDYDPWFGQAEIMLLFSGINGLLALSYGFEMMILEVILNLLLLVLSTYSMAALLWMTGRMLGGHASFAALSAAMIWPMVPSIFGMLVVLPLQNVRPFGFPLPDIVQMLFLLFSFHLMVQTVAEVEGFSAWKSFSSQLLALIISLLPLLLFWKQVARLLQIP